MSGNVVVLTGGVGGAKLVLGLMQVVEARRICAIVNVGDDFRHVGLAVSPDIDTLLYTLSEQANEVQGWGRRNESWSFMSQLRTLGGPDWFALGDGDLALHVLRTARLAEGVPLSAIVRDFARSWNIEATILPASNDIVSTMVETDEGELSFQRYFVEQRCRPAVRSIRFLGAGDGRPAPGVLDAIADVHARAIIIAPSNPYLSIDPILAVPGMKTALRAAKVPVIAVSPVVGGKAVKGPTAKIMTEMGLSVGPQTIATHYETLIDGFLMDVRDAPCRLPMPFAETDTLMVTLDDRARVAKAALDLADRLRS